MDMEAQMAADNNMSMQEVSNMAEGIMGLEASQATGPSTSVSTETVPEAEGITLEGTTASTDVVVPSTTTTTTPTDTTTTTETTTDSNVIVFPDTVDTDVDEEDVVVEVDDTPVDDGGGGGDGGDTEVEVGTGDDGGEGEEEVAEEAPFQCPEGFEAVQINGEWRCQSTEALPERMRPTGGSYYQPRTPTPAASKSAYRFR